MSHLPPQLIEPETIHIWSATTVLTQAEERDLAQCLSQAEIQRAKRFRFPLHKQRFIAAHAMLREVLAQYLAMSPSEIVVATTQHGKPYLPASPLTFNLSHSHDMAVIALRLIQPIGVDIEKIQPDAKEAIAERYFSVAECDALSALSHADRIPAFYRVWARKEAFVKALGLGLQFGLQDFSVALHRDVEMVQVAYDNITAWHLESVSVHPDYQTAFATAAPVAAVRYFTWQPKMSGSVDAS